MWCEPFDWGEERDGGVVEGVCMVWMLCMDFAAIYIQIYEFRWRDGGCVALIYAKSWLQNWLPKLTSGVQTQQLWWQHFHLLGPAPRGSQEVGSLVCNAKIILERRQGTEERIHRCILEVRRMMKEKIQRRKTRHNLGQVLHWPISCRGRNKMVMVALLSPSHSSDTSSIPSR